MSARFPRPASNWIKTGLLVGGLAILIGPLALSPPRGVRRADGDCGLSGMITFQGRLVARGKMSLSCVMLPDPQDVDGYADLTVPVVDGRYAVRGQDGLRPGHYQVTVDVEQLGLRAESPAPADGRPRTGVRGGLVPIFSDCALDIELHQ